MSEVLHLLPTILNIYLLVRLNSYLCNRKSKNIHAITIAVYRILETVVSLHFSDGQVYSLNRGCHNYMIKHTMHVQSLHCSPRCEYIHA